MTFLPEESLFFTHISAKPPCSTSTASFRTFRGHERNVFRDFTTWFVIFALAVFVSTSFIDFFLATRSRAFLRHPVSEFTETLRSPLIYLALLTFVGEVWAIHDRGIRRSGGGCWEWRSGGCSGGRWFWCSWFHSSHWFRNTTFFNRSRFNSSNLRCLRRLNITFFNITPFIL